jgi:hypothetical protein
MEFCFQFQVLFFSNCMVKNKLFFIYMSKMEEFIQNYKAHAEMSTVQINDGITYG